MNCPACDGMGTISTGFGLPVERCPLCHGARNISNPESAEMMARTLAVIADGLTSIVNRLDRLEAHISGRTLQDGSLPPNLERR